MTDEEVPEYLKQKTAGSGLGDLLDLEVLEAGADRVVIGIDVDERLHQPFGIMHGGVNLVLAETAASLGAELAAPEDSHAVGIEINANHLNPVRRGYLKARAVPVETGTRIHVWKVEIKRDDGRTTAVSRCTLTIRARNP